MKLYIKEKVFSWGDQFTVKDACGEDKYIVQGKIQKNFIRVHNVSFLIAAKIKETRGFFPVFRQFHLC